MDDIGPSLPPGWKSGPKEQYERQKETTIRPALPKPVKLQDSEIGPCLPPELTLHASDSELEETQEEQENAIGPTLPPQRSRGQAQMESSDDDSYGPRLPPRHSSNATKTIDKSDTYGPALPPNLAQSSSSSSKDGTDNVREEEDAYGPALPPGFHSKPSDVKGPSLPPNLPSHGGQEVEEEEEEEDMIGPLPWMKSSDTAAGQSATEEFEARARAMKNKLTGKDEQKAPERESWMTELPGYSKNFGLGPRSFRKRDLPDEADRSVWTDTPADKVRKEKEQAEGKTHAKKSKVTPDEGTLSKRDEHLSKQIDAYNQSKRAESLMDIHTKDRKRQLEEESGKPKERRPFDREVDLQVNRFDEARKKNMMKKAAQLGDRFSHSKEKMFL